MNTEGRIQSLENKFIKNSDKIENLFLFGKGLLPDYFSSKEIVYMKRGVIERIEDMMSADEEYMVLTGKNESHPNYDKFMTYARLFYHGLDEALNIAQSGPEEC